MSIPALLSPIQFRFSKTRGRARANTNNGVDAESPESQTTIDEEVNARRNSWSDDDSTVQEPIKTQSEGSDLDEAESYPANYDIRSRLREDLHQLSRNGSPAKLGATLAFWNEAKTLTGPFFINVLREKYPKEPLDLDGLRGGDHSLAEAVKTACHKAGFVLLLGNLEHKRHGAVLDEDEDWERAGTVWRTHRPNRSKRTTVSGLRCYHDDDLHSRHDIGELWEESWHLTRVHDTKGHVVTGEIEINKHNMVQEEPLLGCEPDNEMYPVGYDEYSGDLVTHLYHFTALIIVPRANLLEFLDIRSGIDADSKHANLYTNIHYFIAMMQKSLDPIYRVSFVTTCIKIIIHNKRRPYRTLIPGWFCPALLVGAIHLKDARLCEQIMNVFHPILKVRNWEPFEYWISDVAELWKLLDPNKPVTICEDFDAFIDELWYICSRESVSHYNFDACETGTTLEELEDIMWKKAATKAAMSMSSRGKKRGAEEPADDSHLAKKMYSRY